MSKESDRMVKDAIAAIRKELTSEELDKVNTHLKTIEREFSDVFEDTKAFLDESISRKNKIKELTQENENLKDQVEKAGDKTALNTLQKSYDELKKENENLKGFQSQIYGQRKTEFLNLFDKVKDHTDFDKVKPFLKIPEEKEGKLDWEGSLPEDISNNLAEVEKAMKFGAFADVKLPKPGEQTIVKTAKPQKNQFDQFPGPK